MDIYDGADWTEMDIDDLKAAIESGRRRRVREYVTAQYRQFSKFGPVSLDARLFEDGNSTLLDRLSTEARTGYWDINMMASTGRRK
jgi:hypothetical protein